MSADTADAPSGPPQNHSASSTFHLAPLPPFKPELFQRAWSSTPHPTLPLLATAHDKNVTVFSLSTLSSHSTLTGGHLRSVRSAAWKPGLPPHRLCLVTGSFDSTAGLWRWKQDVPFDGARGGDKLETEIRAGHRAGSDDGADDEADSAAGDDDWQFTVVLEGHENEIKSVAFSPSGQYLATCSRDKSVWIWEEISGGGGSGDDAEEEEEDEWETVAVLSEHDGDVKCVAWCPDVPGRSARRRGAHGGTDVLASASYDNTVRIWREEDDGEWVCVAVLEGHAETVWGLQWEPRPRGTRFPRLLTWSADKTLRVWTLRVDEDEMEEDEMDNGRGGMPMMHRGGLGGIPNTMRRSLREDWDCTAVLPVVHTRDIYSACWSASTGLVASTGSDSVIAVYEETAAASGGQNGTDAHMSDASEAEAAAELDGDAVGAVAPAAGTNGQSGGWRVLTTVANAHGPYEINHITWCKRFDPGCERKGVEEMLVTTGDDGVVRPWQVVT